MKLSKNIPFTVAPNALIQDDRISAQARFLYVYMVSMPDNWEFFMKPLSRKMQMHTDTLRKYFAELESYGWLTNHGQKSNGTQFGANTYTIHATPIAKDSRIGKIPTRKNSDTENSRIGKTPTLIKETSNIKETIKEKKEESSSPDLIQIKQDIKAFLTKAIKRKEWLELTEGLDIDVPSIINTIADAWIGLDRNFNTNNKANQKGIVTFARNWCLNEDRAIPAVPNIQADKKDIVSLGNTPDGIFEIIEDVSKKTIAESTKDYYRPVVAKLLKEGAMDVQTFKKDYIDLIAYNYLAKQHKTLFEKYTVLISQMKKDRGNG